MTEFVARSPKSYCYKYCEKEVKKAKGVPLAVSDKTMECLKNNKEPILLCQDSKSLSADWATDDVFLDHFGR